MNALSEPVTEGRFVWLYRNGRMEPQKWPDKSGLPIGGPHITTIRKGECAIEPAATHKLTADEWLMPLTTLARIFPPPKVPE